MKQTITLKEMCMVCAFNRQNRYVCPNGSIKRLLSVIVLAVISLVGYGQDKKESPIFFNEFEVSVNRTHIIGKNAEGNGKARFGFGVGMYRAFFEPKKVNLITGLEYNQTRQFWKNNSIPKATERDVTVTLHTIAVPVMARYSVGGKVKFMVEGGAFVELNVHATRKGFRTSIPPFGGPSNEVPFKGGRETLFPVNYGATGGIGMRIPVKQYAITVKTVYRLGLHNMDFLNCYYRLAVGFKI